MLNYSVGRRTREISIRLALGSPKTGVVWSVVRRIAWVVGTGLILGLAGGLGLARFVAAFLYQVEPSDFRSIALPVVALLSVISLAALGPVVRVCRVDLLTALRHV